MIKNNKGERQTPKQKAAEIIAGDLCILTDYWYEKSWGAEDMSEAEHRAVQAQLDKYATRILKMVIKGQKNECN